MSSHIAGPIFPFEGRVEETYTVFSGGIFNYSLAAITLINYGVTATSIKLASFFVIKMHSKPGLTVVQTMITTSFLYRV